MDLSWLVTATWVGLSLQCIAMIIDEFWFHRLRGLPRWEVWGHPVDGLVFMFPVSLAAYTQPNPLLIKLFVVLSIVSSLCVTKDEWIHTDRCSAGEQWLHSILFLIHAPLLIAIGTLWAFNWGHQSGLIYLPPLIAGTITMQLFYWIHKTESRHKNHRITR